MLLCTCVGICVWVGQTDACIRSAWWLHARLLVFLHARLCVITYRFVWVLLRHHLKLIPSIQFLLCNKIMSDCWPHPVFLKEHWWKQKHLLNHWSVTNKYMHTHSTINKRIGQPLWPPKIQFQIQKAFSGVPRRQESSRKATPTPLKKWNEFPDDVVCLQVFICLNFPDPIET